MTIPSPVVELEDAIGTQLLLAQLGGDGRPIVANRYEVLELRGRGASGLVCRAEDAKLHRIVALKLYPPLDNPAIEREALREAQALARLEHPNIVGVYDYDQGTLEAGSARQRCMFVSMEFIEGRNLRAWTAEQSPAKAELLRVLLEAGAGLAGAHAAGLIHRDFKPENVMIDESGGVRVVDFGLARSQGVEAEDEAAPRAAMSQPDLVSRRLTRAGLAPGTPQYMAPEALRGQASALSDQFALATTIWEALTGGLPGEGADNDEVKLRASLRATLERALSPDPGERFPDIEAFLTKLRWESGRPRRWFLGSAVACIAGVLTLGAYAFRAQTLEAAAEVSAAAQSAEEARPKTPLEESCAEIEGKWMYDTVVVWANDSARWHGATGHYELVLEPLDGCSLNAMLRKTGDGPRRYAKDLVREGSRGMQLMQTKRGLESSATFQIASDKRGKLLITFNYVFKDGELIGDYQYTGTTGAIWRGFLAGGRSEPKESLRPDLSQASCTSQCRMRCATEASRASCVSERCVDEEADVHECGRPSADTVPPPLTTELIGTSLGELRAELGTKKSKKARRWCTKAAETLVGSWELSAPTWTRTLEVRADGCELEIDAKVADGFMRQHMDGLTTSVGGWVMHDPGGSSPRWALIGWDPAFGVSREGEPLVAHRAPAQ